MRLIDEIPDFDLLSQTLGFGKHRNKLWTEVPAEYLEWLGSRHSPTAGIIRNRHARNARRELKRRAANGQR
jgi:hypothetical protein